MDNNLAVKKLTIELDGVERELTEANFGTIIDLGGLVGPFLDAYNSGLKSGMSEFALYAKVLSVDPKLFVKGMHMVSGLKLEYIRGLSKTAGFALFMGLLEVNGLMAEDQDGGGKSAGKPQASQ